jgi:hypothetical protein
MDGIEPHWVRNQNTSLDSASQFKPIPAFAFSLDKKSPFIKKFKRYDISLK